MIIVMANDPKHLENAVKLQASINSASNHSPLILPFRPVLFKKADFTIIQDERATFIGHGGKARFGSSSQAQEEVEGLTTREFVRELLSKGFPGSVKIIDIIGCNIGLAKNNNSYVTEVATILRMEPSTAHIKVCAFTEDSEIYSRLIVSTAVQTGKVFVSGVKSENEDAYSEILDNLNIEKGRLKYFEETLVDLKKKLSSTSLHERIKLNVSTQLQNTLNAISAVETTIQALNQQKKALRLELHSNDNFRKLLDETPSFHITPNLPAILHSPIASLAKSYQTSTTMSQDKMEKKSESVSSSESSQPHTVTNKSFSTDLSHKKRASNVLDDDLTINAELKDSDIQIEEIEKNKKSKVDDKTSESSHTEDKGEEKITDNDKDITEPKALQSSNPDTGRPSVRRGDLYSNYTQPTLLELARTQRVDTMATLPSSSDSSIITTENQTQSHEVSNTHENNFENTHCRPR